MERYRNANSRIVAYEIGNDYILIEFLRNKRYKYTYKVTGTSTVEAMKILATQNKGLNAYINTYKPRYIKA